MTSAENVPIMTSMKVLRSWRSVVPRRSGERDFASGDFFFDLLIGLPGKQIGGKRGADHGNKDEQRLTVKLELSIMMAVGISCTCGCARNAEMTVCQREQR